jgi:phytoene dehydrogenase-like protein
LIRLAQRVYPRLGSHAEVVEVGTPSTYERFLHRPNGAVGGWRAIPHNTNQNALPYDVGVPGVWLCGDTTWPGLGTVACVLASRHVANAVTAHDRAAVTSESVQSFPATTHAS